MDEVQAQALLRAARVARLATVTPAGRPHVVPVVFAVQEGVVYTAVDGKPKSTRRLRRVTNIHVTPRVSLLVDRYDEDWGELWWVRVDGDAKVVDVATTLGRTGEEALRAKYPQYEHTSLEGPVIVVVPSCWRWWSAS